MKQIVLGSTGISTPQNAFGALPIQRITKEDAAYLLRKAYESGMTFFDTARAYTDSEEKIGYAFFGDPAGAVTKGSDQRYPISRDRITIATKTQAKTPEDFRKDLETSLKLLNVDYIDIYQFHCTAICYRPGDGTGMYEAALEAKEKGLIRHIGATSHLIAVAEEIVESGLYETIQFPLSHISAERDKALVKKAQDADMGFIAMKGMAGGLLTNSEACMAFMDQFDNVVPIWGVQREKELDEWLSFFKKTPEMDADLASVIEKDRRELAGDFCRGCGYCMPCTVDIKINQCARWSQMVRRAPSEEWLSEYWGKELERINDCVECGVCMSRCPYQLNITELLRKNLEDYHEIMAGNRTV